MKKLVALAALAALALPLAAQDSDDPSETSAVAEAAVKENAEMPASLPPVETPMWPAPLGFCVWPETPVLIGLRLSIPFAWGQESVTGIDLGFWGESKDFEGIQVNVIRNKVSDTLGGLQVGLYNSCNRGDCFGIQVGLWNEAGSFRGLQCGLVNIANDAQGFQCGLINTSETLYGYQVGVINVIRSAELPVLPVINIGF